MGKKIRGLLHARGPWCGRGDMCPPSSDCLLCALLPTAHWPVDVSGGGEESMAMVILGGWKLVPLLVRTFRCRKNVWLADKMNVFYCGLAACSIHLDCRIGCGCWQNPDGIPRAQHG